MAAGTGNGPVVALLLQNGADANALHPEGSTALMAAAENGSLPIVKVPATTPALPPTEAGLMAADGG